MDDFALGIIIVSVCGCAIGSGIFCKIYGDIKTRPAYNGGDETGGCTISCCWLWKHNSSDNDNDESHLLGKGEENNNYETLA